MYQAILNGEEHVKDIDYMCTLEAYVHRLLTGKRVLGIGDAAGMFPIDSTTKDYNQDMVEKFDKLVEPYRLHAAHAVITGERGLSGVTFRPG